MIQPPTEITEVNGSMAWNRPSERVALWVTRNFRELGRRAGPQGAGYSSIVRFLAANGSTYHLARW